ncbi:ras-related protein Rab-33A isoform X1 [Mus musculus]|uniref:ras-related protein Rab-33A isoform X1 n=2 Tax=Mus musculus TaxID=10090 RepID=UPI001675815A|nr:ras-related protein Rab-33A isoform X1 [Mus musculus]XP_036017752.1 ras-related protein Rab-33A isoform X1 [Mus musculus]
MALSRGGPSSLASQTQPTVAANGNHPPEHSEGGCSWCDEGRLAPGTSPPTSGKSLTETVTPPTHSRPCPVSASFQLRGGPPQATAFTGVLAVSSPIPWAPKSAPAYSVQVWDTAGQERFRKSMVEHYYRNVHAVVFVYDVTKMTSFTNLKMWIQECNGHAVPPLVPKVLVGNKCDLREQIQVPSNLALKFADAHNMLLFETSAKDPKESQNVESIFMCLACRLKAQKSLLYRDAERQQGKVQKLEFSQEANGKASCPC